MEKRLLESMSGVESTEDTMTLGIDWLIAEDRTYLLEVNNQLLRENRTGQYSKMRHFLGGLDKVNQHILFRDIMPPHTVDRDEFHDFLKANPQVVFKRRYGNTGARVSIFEEPDWDYDLVEKFVHPKTEVHGGKRHAYVIRHDVRIDISGDEVTWRNRGIYRKEAEVSVEEAVTADQAYKLHIYSDRGHRSESPQSEKDHINDLAPAMMESLGMACSESDGFPGALFPGAFVYVYLGHKPQVPEGISDYISAVNSILSGRYIPVSWCGLAGYWNRIPAAQALGADAVLLDAHNNLGNGDYFFADRMPDRSIDIVGQDFDSIGVIPALPNTYMVNELPPDRFAQKILQSYHARAITFINQLSPQRSHD